MSTASEERLYELLPAVYRARDEAQRGQLRTLLRVLEGALGELEDDVEQLYDNWYVETAQEWVVPYIGDLLDVGVLHPIEAGARAYSHRAYVANTIAYRRRKGTPGVLEDLARDITGWAAQVVEFFTVLATTQHLNHQRPANVRTPDLRDATRLGLVDSPFDRTPHTAEARRIASGRGRYGVPNVGLFLWRLGAYPITRAPAAAAGAGGASFRFSQLGQDLALFNLPRSDVEVDEARVPAPLRRRALYDELDGARRAAARAEAARLVYFADPPVLSVVVDGEPVDPLEIAVCDLSEWRRLPATLAYETADGGEREFPIRVGVDPELGRLVLPRPRHRPAGPPPRHRVEVSYHFGAAGELGGGFYDRRETLPEVGERGLVTIGADRELEREVCAPGIRATRITRGPGDDWVTYARGRPLDLVLGELPGGRSVIELTDSETYRAGGREAPAGGIRPPIRPLSAPAGSDVEIRAADRERPHLRIPRRWRTELGDGARLGVNGLLVSGGGLEVVAGSNARLALAHLTLVPGHLLRVGGTPRRPAEPSIRLAGGEGPLTLSMTRCITGRISAPWPAGSVEVEDSVIDGRGAPGEALAAGTARVAYSTVLGGTAATVLDRASDSIFTGPVNVERRQQGCVRYSYLPSASRAPRRYRCVPSAPTWATAQEQIAADLAAAPVFGSTRFGDPGYAQLAPRTPDAVRRGSSDEGEMGVFHHLEQPKREANLRAALDEYLRFGLEAGVVFVT